MAPIPLLLAAEMEKSQEKSSSESTKSRASSELDEAYYRKPMFSPRLMIQRPKLPTVVPYPDLPLSSPIQGPSTAGLLSISSPEVKNDSISVQSAPALDLPPPVYPLHKRYRDRLAVPPHVFGPTMPPPSLHLKSSSTSLGSTSQATPQSATNEKEAGSSAKSRRSKKPPCQPNHSRLPGQPSLSMLPPPKNPLPQPHRVTALNELEQSGEPHSDVYHMAWTYNDEEKKTEPKKKPATYQIVYTIHLPEWRLVKTSELPSNAKQVFIEVPAENPPLLVDGRMAILQIPKWKKKMDMWYRVSDGNRNKVVKKELELPRWVWVRRNFQGIFDPHMRELWLEN